MITPPGEGGVAAIRVAGRRSLSYLKRHFRPISKAQSDPEPFVLKYGHFLGRDSSVIDEVMAVYMPQGRSYTGLDQVEIYCHGGRSVVTAIQDEIVAAGARVAEPGEFTKLAFLAGRIDLTKAEAVAEVVAANTDTSLAAARDHLLGTYRNHIEELRENLVDILAEIEAGIDYPEEEFEAAEQQEITSRLDLIMQSVKELTATYSGGRIINEGYRIAICGRPNAGKSSLFNLLLRQERALVTATPGTTRDYLSEWIDLGGFKVNIIDTAGLRQGGGAVERKGQKSAQGIIASSDMVLWLTDISAGSWQKLLQADVKTLEGKLIILVGNKIDKKTRSRTLNRKLGKLGIVPFSCKTKAGMKTLKQKILGRIQEKAPDLTSGVVVTSARHRQKLRAALTCLNVARRMLRRNESPEVTSFELRAALTALDEITGRIYNEEILGKIFSKFCIGK
ncbi:MAG: tRNA uridine-5-carboxymethylaminomethyl(34) synthesis GTPase MnmE [Candidatus Zixiibacteriota bacterium]|nr:MAG: tRNA uridine-5-carboxymethylaminomethyl(34) synthesis GTPase MnmE [candidate division Zixibacteria bacterium]